MRPFAATLAGRQSADAGRRPAWLIPIRNAQNNPRANDCNKPGKKGQIARSKELGTASVLLATVFGLLMIKESLAGP